MNTGKKTAISLREIPVESDVTGIEKILISSDFFSTEEILVAQSLVREKLILGNSSTYQFLFAVNTDSVIGFTCFGHIPLTASSFDLYWLAVHDEQRGKGLGAQLLRNVETSVIRLGGTHLYVDTSSRTQYIPTRNFYEHMGYQRGAFLPDFYRPDDGKVIYYKRLCPLHLQPLIYLDILPL